MASIADKLLIMYEVGYAQGKVDVYKELGEKEQVIKPHKQHETVSTIAPKLACLLDEPEDKEEIVEIDTNRKKYRNKK